MHTRKKFIFIESNTTGTGELLLHEAIKNNYDPFFITKNPEKYRFLPMSGVTLVILDTENETVLYDYLAGLKNIAGMYSSSEYFIAVTARLASRFDLPSTAAPIIETCRNKYALYLALQHSKIKYPKTKVIKNNMEIESALKEFSLPVVIKPVSGSGSVGVRACFTPSECSEYATFLLNSFPDGILLQEYIDGDEFSVETCSASGQHHILGITKKYLSPPPYFIESGHDFPTTLSLENEKQIRTSIIALLKKINYQFGFAHIELRIKDQNIWIIEVNPRLAGGMIPMLIEKSMDTNVLKLLIDLYTNHPVEIPTQYHRFSSIRHCIPIHAGRIRKLSFSAPESVEVIRFLKKENDDFILQGDYRDRVAYIIVSDPDAVHCREKADAAVKKFIIEIGSKHA